IPIESESIDVISCLHVFEHLLDSEQALAEFRRVLMPGGVLLLATPILPIIIAGIRQSQFDKRVERNEHIAPSGATRHVQAFHPGRLKKLLERADYSVEEACSSHVARISQSKLENCKFWLRINVFLGALFPSF